MSTAREVTVWCDADGCPEWGPVDQYATTASEARRMARGQGWRYRHGRDLCQQHATHQPTEPCRIEGCAEPAVKGGICIPHSLEQDHQPIVQDHTNGSN